MGEIFGMSKLSGLENTIQILKIKNRRSWLISEWIQGELGRDVLELKLLEYPEFSCELFESFS